MKVGFGSLLLRVVRWPILEHYYQRLAGQEATNNAGNY